MVTVRKKRESNFRLSNRNVVSGWLTIHEHPCSSAPAHRSFPPSARATAVAVNSVDDVMPEVGVVASRSCS